MAGIGFELRKIHNREGLLSKQKAYSYAGIIYGGPVILGIALNAAVVFLSFTGKMDNSQRDGLMVLLSYAILASLAVSNLFSFIVTRYISDMLYEHKTERILPSFYASSACALLLGEILYGTFLTVSGISPLEMILSLLLFGELTLIWNAMNYLTVIKDYRSIIIGFLAAIVTTLLFGFFSLSLAFSDGLLCSVVLAYGLMLLWLVWLLNRYFPANHRPSFEFLKWFDSFFDLCKVGIYLFIGLFAHIVVIWFSPLGREMAGIFRSAPAYDIPAMFAFLTTLVSTVNFVISVEVFFYPKFKTYYRLYNEGGNLLEIEESEVEMLEVLNNELKYLGWKQLLATILIMFAGTTLLDYLPLGFNGQMRGYFQTLCLAYGLYAVGNAYLMALLYFADYKGAKKCAGLFAAASLFLTIASQFFDKYFYGFGFLAASALLFIFASARLNAFTEDLPYHVLGRQPLKHAEKSGFFTHLANWLGE
ncbi:exopolysaccharide Pel transporter PelG [Streptococcus sp. H49]|uniref:exopolysaccharide Pel transporter PelG n=1 Tax=Streptococcus huangxiaojuni TaxID=3237239 RepID=UPI0034A26C7D